MKETHLVGYILTYIALFVTIKSKTSIHVKAFQNFNKYIILLISVLPSIFVYDINGLDHLFRMLSFCSGYISLKTILNGKSSNVKDYIHPIFLSGMLVSIYNSSVLRKYTFVLYITYFIYAILLTSNNISDLSTLLNDSILTHLIFFFTKQ